MRITDIKLFPVREEKLKAFVSIILDDCFMVNDIRVIKGEDGFFISMPSRRTRNGKFKDIAHPLNNETRQAMEQEILAAFTDSLDGSSEEPIEARDRPVSNEGMRSEGRRGRPRRRRRPRSARSAASSPGNSAAPADSDRVAPPEKERDAGRHPVAAAEATDSGAEAADSRRRGRDGRNSPSGSVQEPARDSALDSKDSGKSAEEVAEHHLSDSFWST
jgi:stage V sporulation protein G